MHVARVHKLDVARPARGGLNQGREAFKGAVLGNTLATRHETPGATKQFTDHALAQPAHVEIERGNGVSAHRSKKKRRAVCRFHGSIIQRSPASSSRSRFHCGCRSRQARPRWPRPRISSAICSSSWAASLIACWPSVVMRTAEGQGAAFGLAPCPVLDWPKLNIGGFACRLRRRQLQLLAAVLRVFRLDHVPKELADEFRHVRLAALEGHLLQPTLQLCWD